MKSYVFTKLDVLIQDGTIVMDSKSCTFNNIEAQYSDNGEWELLVEEYRLQGSYIRTSHTYTVSVSK